MKRLLESIRRWFGRGGEPSVGVRVPLKRGPGGSSSSVALKEP
jgi:hypothetical protein